MSFPHYLTAGASSRAHYSLLRRLDDVKSPQEADDAVRKEVERCRGVLEGSPSPTRVAETLIILLHCATLAHYALDTEFALVPALKLAEGGGGMRERRLGYMYLCERLPPGHELCLLLVNTIRKDLASDNEGHALLALSAIVALPSVDLAPAVLPLLTSKMLLEHHHPTIRQRTLAALTSLSEAIGEEYPLSLRQLGRLMRHEVDASVLNVLLRSFTTTVESGSRELDASKRRRAYDCVFVAAARHAEGGQIACSAVKAVTAIVRISAGDDVAPHVTEQAAGLLEQVGETAALQPQGLKPHLLEASLLAAALYELNGKVDAGPLLEYLRGLLVPRPKGKEKASSGRTEAAQSPNDHVFVLRCLSLLPGPVWKKGLTEAHMRAIMAGIDSADPTVRRVTLRLLARENATLLELTLNNHLGACRGNGLVPATLSPRTSVSDARALGRTESANRAAEVMEIRTEGLPDSERAKSLVEGVARISEALEGIWVDGVRLLGGLMRAGSTEFRRAVVSESALILSKGADQTVAVLLATVACEFPDPEAAPDVVRALLKAIPDLPPSVQELGMLALAAQLALMHQKERGELADAALRGLDALKAKSVKHIAKRCTQISLLLEREMLDRLRGKRSLEDVLGAVLEAYGEATRRSPASPSSAGLSDSVAPRKKESGLRYTYHQPPLAQSSSRSSGSGARSPASPSPRPKGKSKAKEAASPRSPLERAAELADFKAMGRSMLMDEEFGMDELRLGGR